jgi:hypothetical protein
MLYTRFEGILIESAPQAVRRTCTGMHNIGIAALRIGFSRALLVDDGHVGFAATI